MNAHETLHRLNDEDFDEQAVIDHALQNLELRARKPGYFIESPDGARAYVRLRLAEDPDSENFMVVYLNQRHGVIGAEILFRGTADGASVHPRIVLQRALALNAAAVMSHNHPSGNPEPSTADGNLPAPGWAVKM